MKKRKRSSRKLKIKLTSEKVRDFEIVANQGLVHRVAQRYKQYCSNTSISYDDLFQEGMTGLIVARDRYDPKRRVRFSTFANYWITARILRLLNRYCSTIHVTHSASATYHDLVKRIGGSGDMVEDLLVKVQAQYRDGEISYADYKKFIGVLRAKSPESHNHISLENEYQLYEGGSVPSDSDTRSLEILKHTTQEPSTEQALSMKDTIDTVIAFLTKDEAKLLKMYYGLDGFERHTYEALAEKIGCTRQWAHKTHNKILKKLKKYLDRMSRKDKIPIQEFLQDLK